jgi:hypothetical protein
VICQLDMIHIGLASCPKNLWMKLTFVLRPSKLIITQMPQNDAINISELTPKDPWIFWYKNTQNYLLLEKKLVIIF